MIATLAAVAVLLQQTAPQAPMQGMLMNFLPLALIFVIFYFLLIRPQKNQQKKVQQMLGAMRKGDSVITRAGIFGKVFGIADNIITVEIADNVRVKMTRDAITSVQTSPETIS